MLIIEILLSVILIGTCIYAIISDIKTGKIRNCVLIFSSILALVFILIKFIFFSQDDLLLFFKNASIVILLSLVGYLTRIWAGGDCKFAIFIVFVYPTLFYFDYNSNRFTLWLFIALAFIIGFLYILIDSIILAIKDKKSIKPISATPLIKAYLVAYFKCFAYLIALNQISSAFIRPYINFSPIIYFIVSILLVYVVSIVKFLQNKWIVFIIVSLDIIMMIVTHNFSIILNWYNYLLVITFMIVRALVSKYNYKIIKTEDVIEGMVISKVDTMFMHQYNIKGMPEVSDETLRSRITSEEAQMIRRWGKTKRGKKELTIVRKVPFASFMSIGLIIYWLMGVLQICGLL